jgi:hypothetical protein
MERLENFKNPGVTPCSSSITLLSGAGGVWRHSPMDRPSEARSAGSSAFLQLAHIPCSPSSRTFWTIPTTSQHGELFRLTAGSSWGCQTKFCRTHPSACILAQGAFPLAGVKQSLVKSVCPYDKKHFSHTVSTPPTGSRAPKRPVGRRHSMHTGRLHVHSHGVPAFSSSPPSQEAPRS